MIGYSGVVHTASTHRPVMEVSATLEGSDRAGVLVERHRSRLRHTRGE